MPDTLPSLDLLLRDGVAVPGPAIPATGDEEQLCELYAYAEPGPSGAIVRANMVSTIDGAAWGATGRSDSINNSADFRVFQVLRALADVVLVGAGTARAEGYTPLSAPAHLASARRRAGRRPDLETALITRSGDLPPQITDPRTYPSGGAAPLVITTEVGAKRLADRYPSERIVTTGGTEVDLTEGIAALARRGLGRVLCEGGPSLLGSMLEAHLVDELCLTTSPLIVGGPATRVVHISTYLDADGGGQAAARLRHLMHSDGVLLARWSLARQGR